METLGLNVTDLVILFVIGSSGIISLFRGFTKEFLSLLLWIFAFFAAVGFEEYVTQKILEIVGNPEASKIIASVLIFLVSIVIGGFLINLISRIVKWSGMSGFDKFMGVLFGVSRGLIVILAVYFLLPSNLKEAEIFTESKISPFFEDFLPVLESYIKDLLKESDIEDLIKNGE
jgi:membrane protein required for colicin V production